MPDVIECVVNVSEGRDRSVLDALTAAAGRALLDLHHDMHHHRSVWTLVGEDAPRALARTAVERLDLKGHDGVHPRIGVVDVVPFVPLDDTTMADALAARDRFAAWMSAELGVPCFLYGPERSLPDVRRLAWRGLDPDVGPRVPHPTAGACAVGARPLLVAYNLWLSEPRIDDARRAAQVLRCAEVRALGLRVGDRVQLSMNLVAPESVGPDVAEARARAALAPLGNDVSGAELVGLVPEAVLARIPPQDWPRLDLAPERTIEARIRAQGLELRR